MNLKPRAAAQADANRGFGGARTRAGMYSEHATTEKAEGRHPTLSAKEHSMYPDSAKNLTYATDDTVYWFSSAFDPLNNWSAHAIDIWGKHFPTVEHAYHYRKFSEHLPEVAAEILASSSPWKAMQIERKHREKRRTDWQDIKVAIMTEIVYAKVLQNDDVRECLLGTGTKQLIENSPWDDFWGCGADGTGKNTMGKILMQIRSELSKIKS